MRVHLKTLGCRLNEAELETWSRDFRARGHSITDNAGQADLVVVNTCAVTAEAVRKSRKLMHRVHRDNPQSKLVVSGCLASLEPGTTAESLGVDLVIENRDKDRLVEIAARELDLHMMPQLATGHEADTLLAGGRQRAFIKVQDGCRYQCTFCVVTLARGEERSRPAAEIVDEINRLHAEGIKEAVLSGVHLGGYGSDIGSDLTSLVETVLRRTRIPRLRLGAVEPWDLPAQFWRLFDDPRLLPHLHLPLQSGSDRILRLMARRCKRAEFQRLVESARATVADLNLSTDIIVGFPGEQEQDWRQTLDLCEQIGFGHIHIFAFSPRSGTRAAALPDSLPREVIRARSQQLHELGRRMKRELLQTQLGRRYPVLFEGDPQFDGVAGGYSPNFLRVGVDSPVGCGSLCNRIHLVRITAVADDGESLLGELLPERAQ
ncbi:MAG: tRNA (N(6)-L-threonylcarbamoyladenosine(37)-C(2))-methylthiotransferase MtaB [Gammaproteobacteria bacterium]|nr:tRNA (N(6)-L-threonylcarbamoyladenosine(37)-C(2))-methylthiotransferase MtaB [Gammaproteobacteria bacterium]